ncbi:hypothetical protein [Amycolatopsis cihanbeyliensis]|uniref:Uncharacterized protein n=1 Tax=Amycolatopsis cihanbeyliensis TaxID=1128664 RepID=A0A542DJ57_AMYCI|nr:hypothetical protein [Amycolatopsis cihanbeyliensis]TQJ03132.1 hypothetical protein FB471_2882 [Amycolatopsis cihanbeyliensis]
MDGVGRVERMRAALGELVREQADRSALRERQGEEIKAKSHEYMTKQVQAAERYVEHRRELGKRKEEAGGWATEKTLADKNNVMGFGPEEEPEEPAASGYARFEAPAAAPTGMWQEPKPPVEPAPPAPASPEPSRPTHRAGRHARDQGDFDDEDFSNNQWMK